MIPGLTSALGGVLLAGRLDQSYQGMGDEYLLPAVAAVVMPGGTNILGGRGSLNFWHAIDQDSVTLDTRVRARRDAGATKRFFGRLLEGCTIDKYDRQVVQLQRPQRHLLPCVRR